MMDSATKRLMSLAAIFCLVLIRSTPANSRNTPTAYDVLQGYNFPAGLLPQGVKGYDLNLTTGEFLAYFNDGCSFSKGSYKLKYKSIIKGYISNGKLSSMQGVSVKLFLVWMDIVKIQRTGNNLDFSVGVASTGFPVDYFVVSPQCGCGLKCRNRQEKKLRRNPFISPYQWN